MRMYLMSIYFTGLYLTGVYLMYMHLRDVSHVHVSHSVMNRARRPVLAVRPWHRFFCTSKILPFFFSSLDFVVLVTIYLYNSL
jgi:hypothetical protein